MSERIVAIMSVSLLAFGTALVSNSFAVPCNGQTLAAGKWCKDPYEACEWMLTEAYCESHNGDYPYFVFPGCQGTPEKSFCGSDMQFQGCNVIYSCYWDDESNVCLFNVQQSSTYTTHYILDETCG